ncbi:hypothetical protein A2U01_0095568, partial [Trifolium medium]|nr:hypothetical protein [Trifolium medium]
MHNTSRPVLAGEIWRKSYRKFSSAGQLRQQLATLSQERRPASSGERHAEQSILWRFKLEIPHKS